MRFTSKRSIFILLCLVCTPLLAAEKLLFALDLMRHGDRAPIKPLPNAPYTGETPLGHLTPEGVAKCYQLGTQFRQKYVTQYRLLPEMYDSRLMYVRSTDFDRTLMSAQSVLMGLYPLGTGPQLKGGDHAIPGGVQPIPIHTKDQDNDTMIPCENENQLINKLREKYVYSTSEWQKKHREMERYFSEWEAATGFKIESLYTVGSLGDTLKIYESHQIALPTALTPQQRQELKDLKEWIYLTTWQNYTSAATLGHPLLETIQGYLSDANEQKTPLKYVLFSAHDVTLARTVAAMGAKLPEFPEYNAVLHFALIENDKKQRKVKVLYNNEPLYIPGCKGNICDLNQFKTVIKKAKENADPECLCATSKIIR